ncbi:MAG: helix-turn-helix domain-containing protein [bacterium]|uniref:Helix-turn-helix domain-containing protein n=1 Tax=Candidatus Aphodosoma intestinipullorum TaxID=2840674 RepID=A0A940DKQ5_9BACT|nr:helix-turn-helix domain-containing protein [Candidatus Aphodosoma intestinipullorum]
MMKSEYQNRIIHRIRQLREEHGYTQGNIASIIGISNGQMGNIESPKTSHKYTLAHIQQICKEFKYPIELIFLDKTDFSENNNIIDLLIDNIVKYER